MGGGLSANVVGAINPDGTSSMPGVRLEQALEAAWADPACRSAFVRAVAATAPRDINACVPSLPGEGQPPPFVPDPVMSASSVEQPPRPSRGATRKRLPMPERVDPTIAALDGAALVARLFGAPTLAPGGELYGVASVQHISQVMYLGGTFGRDGCLYMTPARASRVACFDPATGKITLVGDDFGMTAKLKWSGGVLCDDGCIYALPHSAEMRVLKIDPASGTATRFGGSVSSLGCPVGWEGTTQGPDGKLYAVPGSSTSVLCFDPATGELSTFGELQQGEWKYTNGGVLAPDGCIYTTPSWESTSKRVLRIDPVKRTTAFIGDEVGTNHGWWGGAVGCDGCVYFPPASANCVLRIDPATQMVMLIGEELVGDLKWMGAFAGSDGCVYGVPFSDEHLLRIEPFTATAARVGPPLGENAVRMFHGAAMASDGTVWVLPLNCPSVPHRVESPPIRQLLNSLLPPAPPNLLLGVLQSEAQNARLLSMLAALAHTDAEGMQLVRGCLRAGADVLPECVLAAPARRALAAALQCMHAEPALTPGGAPIGGTGSEFQYEAGTFARDGRLYLIPRIATRVACYDLAAGSHTLIGDDLGDEATDKWANGFLCNDGCIYALPCKASRVLRIDPAKGTAEPFGDDIKALGCKLGWEQTLQGPDGKLYATPCEASSVLCFDPATGKVSTFGDLQGAEWKYTNGVLAPNGCIYAAPWDAKHALCIDPVQRTMVTFGSFDTHNQGWWHGACGNDGCIYFPPARAPHVLRINPASQTAEPLVGASIDHIFGGRNWKWMGAFTGPDGCVYGIPHDHTQLLCIDPFAGTVTCVGTQLPARPGLAHTTVAADGTVWALPFVGSIAPHRFELPQHRPFATLVPMLADNEALCAALMCDTLRPPCTRLLASAAVNYPNATPEQKLLGELARTKFHPAFAAAAARSFSGGVAFSLDTHLTMLEAIAQVSPYLTGLIPWTPAPTSLADWQRPAKQPAAKPLAAALRDIEMAGPAALDAAWMYLAPISTQALAVIIAAVQKSEAAQAVLLELYEQARQMSLQNYKGPLLRCRREPTFFEYQRQSKKLLAALRERATQCRQLEPHFPRLIQQAAAIEPLFMEFVEVLSQRTRAESGLPPEKPSRQKGGRCLKGAWRVIEKMTLRPGAVPQSGLSDVPPERLLSEVYTAALEPTALEPAVVVERARRALDDCAPLTAALGCRMEQVLDASKLFDILRGSIKCNDFTQLVAVLDLLLLLDDELGGEQQAAKAKSMSLDLNRFGIRLHRFKCRFTTPTSGGWADALINFSFVCDKHKHVVELQLQHETLLVIRKEGKAHEAYAGFRSAFELLDAIDKAPVDVFDESGSVDELSPIEEMRRELDDAKKELATTKEELVKQSTRIAALEARVS